MTSEQLAIRQRIVRLSSRFSDNIYNGSHLYIAPILAKKEFFVNVSFEARAAFHVVLTIGKRMVESLNMQYLIIHCFEEV